MSLVYKMATTCKILCYVFGKERGSKLHTLHLANLYTKHTEMLIFVGCSWSKHKHGQQLYTRKDKLQEMHVICCKVLL